MESQRTPSAHDAETPRWNEDKIRAVAERQFLHLSAPDLASQAFQESCEQHAQTINILSRKGEHRRACELRFVELLRKKALQDPTLVSFVHRMLERCAPDSLYQSLSPRTRVVLEQRINLLLELNHTFSQAIPLLKRECSSLIGQIGKVADPSERLELLRKLTDVLVAVLAQGGRAHLGDYETLDRCKFPKNLGKLIDLDQAVRQIILDAHGLQSAVTGVPQHQGAAAQEQAHLAAKEALLSRLGPQRILDPLDPDLRAFIALGRTDRELQL